jgi:PIN domain nuclease of toxin-antitoxin system
VRVLLDTHAFLWFVAGDAALSAIARATIEDVANDVFVSVASAWEVAIKVSLGKLMLDAPSVESFFDEQMDANGFAYLPVDPAHVFRVGRLPFHHRDPFDRLLIAQALEEGIALVTRELATFAAYGPMLIW